MEARPELSFAFGHPGSDTPANRNARPYVALICLRLRYLQDSPLDVGIFRREVSVHLASVLRIFGWTKE